MITYKNLRDFKRVFDSKLHKNVTTITVDVYETNSILGWFKNKDKFIKTSKLIKVYNVWRDLDNEHLPIDNASQIEILIGKYESLIINQKFEDLVIEAIESYK